MPRISGEPDIAPRKPLRIALLGYRSQPYSGGQGVYLKYLSKALVEAGHQVDVISGPPYPHLDGCRSHMPSDASAVWLASQCALVLLVLIGSFRLVEQFQPLPNN